MKKKVYIISHSHWDREWYVAYEKHHMLLVELMDDLLEIFETDSDFNSFHLDGQTIILDDYLQVRPEKRAAVQKAINDGKLRIGPFYILQDDWLISPESNVRNMLIGMEESRKWGTPVKLGYFPDTFGNMGQAPQLMQKAGFDAAAFGRGVKPIGFDNQVLESENYTSQYSEMWWKGPDQSEIFGLLFANWYSNGNEIPAEKEAAIKFWNQKLADAEKFASTNHLLFMNGCDHQPVQKDVTKAIALANELYPDYEFIHSNFTDYLEAVRNDLPEDLGSVTGELTSQETDGWYTLANTASARVYLKQWNTRVQRQLENIAEPLASMAYEVSGKYPHDQLDYAWKTLMQNHPHDSICGCSVDEVHREMVPRFEKANEVGKYVAEEAVNTLKSAIDTSNFAENSFPFVVFNTNGLAKSGEAEIEIELARQTFAEGYPAQCYHAMAELPQTDYHVEDENGHVIPATISEAQVRFDFDLPKDGFRIPYMKRYVTVQLPVKDLPAFSWQGFALVPGREVTDATPLANKTGTVIENQQMKVEIADNGTLTVTDKETQVKKENLLVFENVGDIANEYIFKQPENDQAILSSDVQATITLLENHSEKAVVKITHVLDIPVSADELLDVEQQMVIDFTQRKAQRSKETAPLTIETLMTVTKDSKKIDFETHVNNQMKDHRLRVLFETGINVEQHEADSIYEVVTRPNAVSASWKNPTNPQHQHAFANLHDTAHGVTVGNFGLNEYEIVGDTIAVTLLRCVRELGDWGYFPTPEAQCLGEHTFNYSIEMHATPETRYATYKHAYTAQVPFTVAQVAVQKGNYPTTYQYVKVEGETFIPTALKRRKVDQELILRGYNMSDEMKSVTIEQSHAEPEILTLLEEPTDEVYTPELQPYEIRTIGLMK
ncbi:alpha-mannosidase [Candidatus Enterococcus willemsii]|uniref:Alpha-mannosidase n=1 Tax=Candidatus Enterococcus willemsii TaxID=1857215 RepID=A0ABQ6YWP5_9ENTE|nr:alpha-mannosidase [Enterococcus sp. CU12B]KAF1302109.1 alpha-mannosidase [Enterococcus sp. CU12B]